MTTSNRYLEGEQIAVDLPASVEQLDRLLDSTGPGWHLAWLEWMTSQLPMAVAALVVTDEEGDGQFHPRALWPVESTYDHVLQDSAAAALRQQSPLITPMDDGFHQLGSYPVKVGDRIRAVVTLLFSGGSDADMHRVLAVLEYCAGWLELALGRLALGGLDHQLDRQQLVIDSISRILGERDFEHAALRFVNLMGRHLEAERVVLGFVRGGEVHIHSESDSSGHSKKHELVKHTAAALQEAVDQQESIVWPQPEGSSTVCLSHSRLAEAEGARSLITVPLVDKELCYGAILFERSIERPYSPAEQSTAEALANYVGVVLEEKRQSSLPLHAYVRRSIRNQLARLLGPGYLIRKIVLLSAALVTLFFSFMPGVYRLGAEAVLEGAELRAVVVPFEGYVESASYRAGDRVEKGDTLAELDTRELHLQRVSWTSQQATSRRQYEDAVARQERAQVQIARAQMDRAAAELQLLDFQIAQATMVAPFDALVVSGDLSQRIGSVVRQGDVLFELAPSRQYRLALYVDEFRINDVEPGQQGSLVAAALPDQEFEFLVTRINPIAEVRDGATVYRVEADLVGDEEQLSVGLEGVAKITVDERLLFSIWTRGVRDWLRLQIWRLWG